jgi:endonuclease YncB( thermonuclease family)
MSRHWKPDRRAEWTVIDGYASSAPARSGLVPVIISAVVVGLAVGGALSWTARNAAADPSAAIEWNAVQAVPTRAADAEDVQWERRAEDSPVIANDSGATQAGLPRPSRTRNDAAATAAFQTPTGPIYVIDGDTFVMSGQKIRIAGIDAPETHPSRCAEEARLGLAATQKLRELLSNGAVAMSGTIHDEYGREVRTVRVNGADVGAAMVGAGVAREYGSGRRSWC